MGYPYEKTYLECVKKNKDECRKIREAFYVLLGKYLNDNDCGDSDDLAIRDLFKILGEAFELSSPTVEGITDTHHFMWDILDELLGRE